MLSPRTAGDGNLHMTDCLDSYERETFQRRLHYHPSPHGALQKQIIGHLKSKISATFQPRPVLLPWPAIPPGDFQFHLIWIILSGYLQVSVMYLNQKANIGP